MNMVKYSFIMTEFLSGHPQQTISAIESGARKNPGVETLLPLARAMGCLVDDLIAEDSDDKTEAV